MRAGRGVALGVVLGSAVILGGLGLGQPPADLASVAIGRVTSVYDGDTFTVRWDAGAATVPGNRTDVRPYLIDAPERSSGECYWEQSRDYAKRLLLSQTVWVYHWGWTSGKRLLGFVYLDPERQSWFGAVMVAQGYASLHEDAAEFASTQIPKGQGQAYLDLLQRMEDEAREADRGLWGLPCDQDGDEGGETAINVLIHSMLPNPPGDERGEGTEWIKVVNVGDTDADISGWELYDEEGSRAFPDGTVLAPGQLAETASCFSTRGLCLANDGDEVFLRDANGTTVDSCSYTNAATNQVIDCLKDD